jgi:Arabinose efflux permease
MKIREFINKSSRWLSNLTVGGVWGRTQDASTQRNLRWFWFDGLFASASDNISLNYISLYVLALGATESQIGLMSSFSNIAAALLLLPGALLAERVASKKVITLFCGGGGARLALLMLVFVPILFKGPNVVWIAIAVSTLRDSFNNFGYPSWVSVTNDTVPIEGRGRYFGSRNFVMGITGMITTLLAGKLITVFVSPIGYQIALGMAFVLGASSTFSYAHIFEHHASAPAADKPKFAIRELAEMFHSNPQFVALLITTFIWNFGLNIAGPFFNVYMVQNLKFTAAAVGITAVVSSLSALFVQNQIGWFADRLGSRRLQLLSMCVIPSLPLAWIFATQVWHIVIINTFGGIMWCAYNLAYFNLLLVSIPQNQVPRYSAVYQIVVTLSLAAGALVGSALIAHWGFIAVCLGSALFRIIATVLFAKMVHEPQKNLINYVPRRKALG